MCVRFGPVQPNQGRVQSWSSRPSPPYKELAGHSVRGVQNLGLKQSCVFLVKHPSGDGDAVYKFVIKIAAEVLVFIKDCRALV